MNIDELLREHGERWQATDLGEPDLGAALGRRRRRTAVRLVTATVVSALAVSGVVWASRPGTEVPAVPAPLSSPSGTPTAVVSPVPTPTTDVPIDRIAQVAVKMVDQYSKGTPPATAQVVGTTLGEVVEEVAVGGNRPVWLVQAVGTFRCGEFSYCSRSRGGSGTGPVLQVIIRQSDLSILHTATFGVATKLNDLGPVFGVDLDAAR